MADIDKDRAPSNRGAGPGGGPGNRGDMGRADDPVRQATAETARDVKDLAGRAKDQGISAMEQQKHAAAGQMDSVAHAFRSAASQLQDEDKSQAGRYVDMAAQRLESFANELRGKDMDTLLRDAENMGRRAPATLFAGSLVAGFLLARFLKSSAQRRSLEGSERWEGDEDRFAERERSFETYGGEPDGAIYEEREWAGPDTETGASEIGMAGSVLPDEPAGPGPTTVVRSGDGADTSPSSLNESRPGGNNYGNR